MKKFLLSLVTFLTLSVFAITSAFAGSATLQWNPNSEPDLKGYKVYIGSVSTSYDRNIDVENITTYKVENLAPGFYYFAVTAYDTSNLESDYSNEVDVEVENFPPAPPTGCMIIEIMPD